MARPNDTADSRQAQNKKTGCIGHGLDRVTDTTLKIKERGIQYGELVTKY